jgi:hypothetical protein
MAGVDRDRVVKFASVRKYALSLPDVTEQPHFDLGSFRVRGRIFVTVAPDRQRIHVFLSEPDRERALAMHPAFTEKLLWGGKVVGLRVALARAAPGTVRQLVRQAWSAKAPRTLVARVAV